MAIIDNSTFKKGDIECKGVVNSPFSCEPFVRLESRAVIYPGCSIGAYTYINGGQIREMTSIGRYCSISYNVIIGAQNHDIDLLSTHPFTSSASYDNRYGRPFSRLSRRNSTTEIGHDVWIGHGAIIMSGVRVGHGAVIGAGAVCTKDVPPYAIVAGVPARLVRYRFPENLISLLLDSNWWCMSRDYLTTLPVNNIESCLDAISTNYDQGLLAASYINYE